MESETVWRALASPHRRKLLDLLRDGPRTTGQLVKELPDLSRFAVMQHLGVLEEAGLVLYRKEGRKRFNFANPIPVRELYERWVSKHASTAAETAQHLKRYAETTQEVVPKMDQQAFRHVVVEMEMRVKASVEKVFAAMTDEYDNWWPHRYKPDSTVFCEAKVGGKIGERFSGGGGAIYGEVVYIDAPRVIISAGASALNQGMQGYSKETLEADGEHTIYRKHMQLWGVVPPEMEQMFREGARALMEQALRGYVEEGVTYQPPA